MLNFLETVLKLKKEKKKEKKNLIMNHVKVLVTQACLTLCDSMDRSTRGSSVHGIFQAKILEWVTISFSRRSSLPRDWVGNNPKATLVKLGFHPSWVSCLHLTPGVLEQGIFSRGSYKYRKFLNSLKVHLPTCKF